MPIDENLQPPIVSLSDTVRLVAYDGDHTSALTWYKDPFVYYNSEGITDEKSIPDDQYIQRMYTYLHQNSELYFIECFDGTDYIRVGDVAIKATNPPIVIGDSRFRGKGYSKLIMTYVIERLKSLGYDSIENSVVYKHNSISLKMHRSLGFTIVKETDDGYFLSLDLKGRS